jgi:hypothetical protein
VEAVRRVHAAVRDGTRLSGAGTELPRQVTVGQNT